MIKGFKDFLMRVVAERRARGEESGPALPTDVELLTEIRDLLAERDRRDPPSDTADRVPRQER